MKTILSVLCRNLQHRSHSWQKHYLYMYQYLPKKSLHQQKKYSKHPTPMTIQLHPQCLLGIQSILRNWTFLIFKQV